MRRVRARKLCVSVVTVEEILEGSTNREEAVRSFSSLTVQPIGWAHAIRCAALQAGSATRLAENDAWIVATAQLLDADILGRDRSAFTRLGARYLTF